MSLQTPESFRRDERPQEIVARYRRDLRAGRRPSREALLARYAEHRAELTRLLEESEDSGAGEETVADGTSGAVTAVIRDWPGTGEHGGGVEPPRAAPESLGEYRVLREIGRGGMGVVYEAEHVPTQRRVALKLVSRDLPRNDETVARFRREARLAASLSHPNSTFVYDAGEHDGDLYIAMELMPGRTLQDVVEESGTLPVARAVDYLLDACRGLEAAHRRGIVHRDMKPSNCFLGEDGRVKVGDFGLSKSVAAATDLTLTGTFLGSPLFAAPEQCRGADVDERTDVYGAGATLYYLLAGRAPFTGHAAAVISQIVADRAPGLRKVAPHVPAGLSSVVTRALEKDPKRRYRNVGELRRALLPYSSRGTSIADVGLRLAAYFLDVFAMGVGTAIVAFVAAVGVQLAGYALDQALMQAWVGTSGLVALIVYFAVAEGVWGRGIGKRLVGLSVTDQSGDPPGWPRALVRAAIVPGIPLLPSSAYSHFFDDGTGTAVAVLVPQLVAVGGWLLGLVFFVTMRRRNGYRGLHEIASGTRVVRARSDETAPAPRVPRALAPAAAPPRLRHYRVIGEWPARDGTRVLAGRDEALDRSVFLVTTALPGRPPSPARIRVTRRARAFWLQGGIDGDVRWDAFESVAGAPLSHAIDRGIENVGPLALRVLADLAGELEAALDDGTLPEGVSLAHVWVDTEGQVKLLDVPLGPVADAACGGDDPDPRASAERLFRAAAGMILEKADLCADASDFLDEVRRGNGALELSEVAGALRRLAERRHELRWDDRLGIVAVSWGIESALLSLAAILGAWVRVFAFGARSPESALLLGGVVLLLPAVLGYSFRGGPTFSFTEIAVRRRAGGRAGRLRCAWRNLVAWACAALGYTALGVGITVQLSAAGTTDSEDAAIVFGLYALVFCLLLLLQFLGALYAILRPRCGLQDILAGTRLFPR